MLAQGGPGSIDRGVQKKVGGLNFVLNKGQPKNSSVESRRTGSFLHGPNGLGGGGKNSSKMSGDPKLGIHTIPEQKVTRRRGQAGR